MNITLYHNLYNLAKRCVETAQGGSHNGSLKILEKAQPSSYNSHNFCTCWAKQKNTTPCLKLYF